MSFICCYLAGQPPKSFLTKFGTTGVDVAYSVKESGDRYYWVAGQTSGFGFGSTDAYLAKLDTMGNIVLQKSYGGFLGDCAKALFWNPTDSGCFVAGYTQSFGNGGYDMYFFRVDKNGSLLWQNYYGGTDWDFANSIVLGLDGNLYIVGETFSFGNGQSDGVIIKVNPVNGVVMKSRTLGGVQQDVFNSVISISSVNLMVCGTTKSRGDVNGDILVSSWNTNLDTIYTRVYGTPYRDAGNGIMQHPNGQLWIAGASATMASQFPSRYALFLDANANPLFSQYFPDLSNQQSEGFLALVHSKINQDRTLFLNWYFDTQYNFHKMQGYFYIGGVNNAYLIANAFGANGNEYVFAADATSDGGYIIVGQTYSYNSQNGDFFVVKIDTNYVNYPSIVGLQEGLAVTKEPGLYCFNKRLYFYNFRSERILISIYDAYGKQIRKEFLFGKGNLDISDVPNGIYVVRAEDAEEKRFFQKKILVD